MILIRCSYLVSFKQVLFHDFESMLLSSPQFSDSFENFSSVLFFTFQFYQIFEKVLPIRITIHEQYERILMLIMKVIAMIIYGWFGARVLTCLAVACLVWLLHTHLFNHTKQATSRQVNTRAPNQPQIIIAITFIIKIHIRSYYSR